MLPTSSKKQRTWITYSLLVLPATAFALGYWQIHRRRWKIDLIEKINARIPAKPIQLPKNVDSSIQLPEFTHISVRGYFDHSREVVIGPRSLIEDFIPSKGYGSEWVVRSPTKFTQANMARPSAPGYFIVTPFFLEDRPGTSILVNRGWVPYGARDPTIRPNGQVKGVVELSGYIRYQEKAPIRIFRSTIQPLTCLDYENQNPHIRYPCRQIDQMSSDLKTLPIFVDADYASIVYSLLILLWRDLLLGYSQEYPKNYLECKMSLLLSVGQSVDKLELFFEMNIHRIFSLGSHWVPSVSECGYTFSFFNWTNKRKNYFVHTNIV